MDAGLDLVLILCIIFLPVLASVYINTTYKKYKKVSNHKKLTGFDTARKILDKNGLKDVLILEVSGDLTDHYDPTRKVVKLSHDIYHGSTIAAMAVAAHECGHAIQDKENYVFLRIRSFLVPIVNICSNIGYIFIVLAFILEFFDMFYIGIGLSLAGVLFQLVTLPVEFNASHRALIQLDEQSIAVDEENSGAKTMLTAAALTYVASLLAMVLQIVRFILLISNRRD